MSFIENIKNRAKLDKKTIVLPETMDIRIMEATEKMLLKQASKTTTYMNIYQEIISY